MRWFILIFVLVLSACATSPLPQKDQAITLGALDLPAQTLREGECGLFVWSADEARRFILFAQSQNFTAHWQDGTARMTLTITDQDGIPAQGQFPTQRYDNGMTLRLSKAQSIDMGTRYKGGTLSLEDVQGWHNVKPVIGVSTCR